MRHVPTRTLLSLSITVVAVLVAGVSAAQTSDPRAAVEAANAAFIAAFAQGDASAVAAHYGRRGGIPTQW